MRMVLKKCFILFIFIKRMLFIWSNLFNYIFIYFWYTLVLYWVCLPTTQNIMFSALKPKPFSSTLSLLLRWKNNEQHCFQQFPADLVTFTVEILNGKLHFLCSATNCSTVATWLWLPLLMVQLTFLQLLFTQILLLLQPFTPSTANC